MRLTRTQHSELLRLAEINFKLALGLRNFVPSDQEVRVPRLPYHTQLAWGRHSLEGKELELTVQEEIFGAGLCEHVATYVLVLQVDKALEDRIPDRFHHTDQSTLAASWIARLVRNAFAHNPFYPTWRTYPECADRTFTVPGAISLTTTGLDSKVVKYEHYGGPLALLALVHFVRSEVG